MENLKSNTTEDAATDIVKWKEETEEEWDELHPRRLIPELCKQFYHLGW